MDPCVHLFSGKARCFSQSERELYGNFVIIHLKNHPTFCWSLLFIFYDKPITISRLAQPRSQGRKDERL